MVKSILLFKLYFLFKKKLFFLLIQFKFENAKFMRLKRCKIKIFKFPVLTYCMSSRKKKCLWEIKVTLPEVRRVFIFLYNEFSHARFLLLYQTLNIKLTSKYFLHNL